MPWSQGHEGHSGAGLLSSFLKAVFPAVPNHGLLFGAVCLEPPLTSCIYSLQLCSPCLLPDQIMITCFIGWVYLGLYFKLMKSLVTQEDRLILSLDGPKIAEFLYFVIEDKWGNLNKYGVRIELESLGKV